MSLLPITKQDVADRIIQEKNNYYSLLESGASNTDLSNQLKLIDQLQYLLDSFENNNQYDVLKTYAMDYFNNAIKTVTITDIQNAFDAFSSLSAFIKDNSIGYDTTTNTPIFSTVEIKKLFDNNGNQINVVGG